MHGVATTSALLIGAMLLKPTIIWVSGSGPKARWRPPTPADAAAAEAVWVHSIGVTAVPRMAASTARRLTGRWSHSCCSAMVISTASRLGSSPNGVIKQLSFPALDHRTDASPTLRFADPYEIRKIRQDALAGRSSETGVCHGLGAIPGLRECGCSF